jgi:hypothetical protein
VDSATCSATSAVFLRERDARVFGAGFGVVSGSIVIVSWFVNGLPPY